MGAVIDIGIGLAFVFALTALVCSGLQEWLSASLNLRGRTLWEGVQSMLLANAGKLGGQADPGHLLDQRLAGHPLVTGRVADRFGPLELARWLLGRRQPTADTGSAKPSYMDAATFATALADAIGAEWKGGSRRYDDFALAVAAMPDAADGSPGPLKTLLQKMVDESRGDPARLRAAVEAWYDETMQRVTGWYKRRVQVLLVATGIVVAAGLNIDALFIAGNLASNAALRSSLAEQAVAATADYNQLAPAAASAASSPTDALWQQAAERGKQNAEAAQQRLQALNLPIGWAGAGRPLNVWTDWVLLVLGWLLTGLAASFGAPFWFELIGRLAPLRAAGKKPPPAADAAVPPAATTPVQPVGAPGAAALASAGGASPFRDALNEFEARGIAEADLLRVKRLLGITGPGALLPLLDQPFRNAIAERQQLHAWPATGELSAAWVQALIAGRA